MLLKSSPVTSSLKGEVVVPGDKSVSHRSLMLLAIADGRAEVTGLLEGEDCMATAAAMQAMGARITRISEGHFAVDGVGLRGLRRASKPIDLGNSGTGMRLLSGLLAAQPFPSTLVGDTSLTGRPMGRVIDPLSLMGAKIGSNKGCAPLEIAPSGGLVGIRYEMPIASAQLKSALMLAGLYATSPTQLIEPGPSRDHTERMLSAMGVQIDRNENEITVHPASALQAIDIQVPADLSSAAFFMVAASIVPGSALKLVGVGVNSTRAGVITILQQMGAKIELTHERMCGGEPVADVLVSASQLNGISLDPRLVPLAIDEFPILFIAAALAKGRTHFSGLAELRHKESDRIGVMVDGLRALGADVEAEDDWVIINGGTLQGGQVDSHGDHRIAMSFAVAATVADGPISVEKPQNIATSFPKFVETASSCGLDMDMASTP